MNKKENLPEEKEDLNVAESAKEVRRHRSQKFITSLNYITYRENKIQTPNRLAIPQGSNQRRNTFKNKLEGKGMEKLTKRRIGTHPMAEQTSH